MTTSPYIPTPLAVPIVNPAVATTGNPPIPYISNSVFSFAPTAIDAKDLVSGSNSPQAQAQGLADVLGRASSWADEIAFGADPAGDGASLAASLSVESAYVRLKGGELRLICDYRPILQVVGIDVGLDPSSVSSIGPSLAAMTRVGRRTIYVPSPGVTVNGRPGDTAVCQPRPSGGGLYAVWSYVTGYAHTQLAAAVTADATSCVVQATDGNGGLWGVFPASGSFPGTALTLYDQALTERVFVQAIAVNTPSAGLTTLTTTPFANAHSVPAAPDFIPVSAIPKSIQQAVITLTMCLVKTRGGRSMTMPTTPGGRPTRKAMGQAGLLTDFDIAEKILHDFGVRMKRS